jgi:tetratricopeptide (TPR) repeat protein
VRVLAPSGAVLDEGLFDVHDASFLAYNALGAAPLYAATIRYSSSPSPDEQPQMTFFGGQRIAEQRLADDIFEEPPKSLQSQTGFATRVVIGEAQGGYRSTLNYLFEHGQVDRAATVARAAARAAPEHPETYEGALRAIELAQGLDAAIAFSCEALERRPDDFDIHRSYQYLMRRADRVAELRVEYRARHEKDPESLEASVLLARTEPPAEAAQRLDQVLQAHPDAQVAALTRGWIAFCSGDTATAAATLAKGSTHPHYPRFVLDHARALVALGRTPEAVALVAKILDGDDASLSLAVFYSQLAELPGAGTLPAAPLAYVEKLAAKPTPGGSWNPKVLVPMAWSLLGEARGDLPEDKSVDPMVTTIVRIQIAAGTDPEEAWKLCSSAPPGVLGGLSPTIAVLLAAEFARAGDSALAERMLGAHTEIGFPAAALLEHARTGADHPELWRLDPEMHAALALVRARALEASGKSGAPLYATAEREDALHGVVTRARTHWPALAPAPTPSKAKGKPNEKPGGIAL